MKMFLKEKLKVKRKTIKILLIFLIGFAVIILSKIPDYIERYQQEKYDLHENEDVINVKSFSAKSNISNTQIDATTFIFMKNKNKYTGKLIANFNIDKTSEGINGIRLSFKEGVRFLSCNYDYPEGISSEQKRYYVTGYNTEGKSDVKKGIWIGDFPLDTAISGSGVLLLEFEINQEALTNNELEITVDMAGGSEVGTCRMNISNGSATVY